ncbi:MAG: FAD-dependent monooxygenase, partial [Chromatocurvus sp.]
LGNIRASSPRAGFPLRQRHAINYVESGVALVADAAHTIHPLAGQGINLGLADVDALAGVVLEARQRDLSPGALSVLQRYQRRRKGSNLAMMAAMDGFRLLFGSRQLPVRWLRNAGLRQADALPVLKKRLMRHAMGLAE